ncbi:peptide deformylase [Candidatus Peregrinibacteria bacterium]|nr:peptide deformylase [Candidatus Peregrinibacteria bacterium]
MSSFTIETGKDNPVLRAKAKHIDRVDKSIKKLASNMIDSMKASDGMGLAAPQVGISKRIVIVLLNYNTDHEMIVPLINPEITYFSDDAEKAEEGCLSLPGVYKQVERSTQIRLTYTDIKGKEKMLVLEDMNARVVQHEVDHLDGILFIDRVKEQVNDA